ncbi:phosphate signaling complex protein PhoU [bacterium]|nr:phosphate signaling complex protein PhoU [bacterium]
MSTILRREIEMLKRLVLSVGAMVEDACAKAIHALNEKDEPLARSVIEADREIDKMEVRVEEECMKILALHQPVAQDLRFVISVMKMNNDLERMGDLAANIAKRAVYISTHQSINLELDFPGMAKKSQSMVKRSLDSLVNADSKAAQQVIKDDDEVDRMRKNMEEIVMNELKHQPEHAEHLLKFASVARHLERLADMATNIAEDVIYMVEGDIIRHQGS